MLKAKALFWLVQLKQMNNIKAPARIIIQVMVR
jgi:hypothetical protein